MTANGLYLRPPPGPVTRGGAPMARSFARDAFGREIADAAPAPAQLADPAAPATPPAKRDLATDALGRRAGALSDELDFPAFVASLVHGTFDAIVDSSIRQMESFADLVAAVAKPLEQFTNENVTPNQARDYLVDQYPRDVALSRDGGAPTLVPIVKPAPADGSEAQGPTWLADYGLDGQELTPELLETQVLPHAREAVAKQRLQTLSTMVLLGMNRVVVKDGSINARVRFRAAAADHTKFDYATGADPAGGAAQWTQRGSTTYDAPSTKVSTVGVNVQADSDLKAELFGEVKINFASETVPLDRFVDDAKRGRLERHSRGPQARVPSAVPVAAPPVLPPPATIAATPAPAAAGAAR